MHSATPAQPIERTTQHLDEQGIAYEVVEHEQAFGAASEAVASGVPPDDAAKSVLPPRNSSSVSLSSLFVS